MADDSALPAAATARTFLDFEGLGRLRGQARADGSDREALREAARQFEAQMLHMMLQAMRQAVERDESNNSGTQDLYQEMMDREVALLVARSGGVGMAEAMVRQLDTLGITSAMPATPDDADQDTLRPLRPDAAAPLPLAPAEGAQPATWRVLQERAAGSGLTLTPATMETDR